MSIDSLARPEIVAMKPYSSARKEAPGRGILLNANESPWSLLENSSLENTGLDGSLNRYPDPQPQELVSRLAILYDIAEKNVLATRGSDEGIDLLTRVFCRAGEDAILHCPPTFGMYAIAAQTQGAAIVSVPRLPEDSFRMDETGILDALASDARIKLVFLTSPNNPTGDAIDQNFLQELVDLTAERALVVVDEAYTEFCRHPSAARSVISLLRRVIAPYPLATPVISLACRMLDPEMLGRQQKLLTEVQRNKTRLLLILQSRPFIRDIWPGEANFVLLRVDNPDGFLTFCAARGVILRGYPNDPMLKSCIRVSVGSEQDLGALESALDAWEAQ